MTYDVAKLVVIGIFVTFALFEMGAGRFLFRRLSSRKDVIIDVICTTALPALVLPLVLWCSTELAQWALPATQDQFEDWPWWAMFGTLLVADDLTQYGWHRLSHTSWLYPLHRAHHSASYLSVRVVYRNNVVYYALMPGLWLSGLLLHWGFLSVYVIYMPLKMLVIISAHASVRWDTYLLRWRVTRPLMWVLERLISTPTTHAAHHGLHEDDGVTHYRGNYGNFLFLWDIIFGSAKITRRRPESYGIEGLAPIPWYRELLWPTRERRL
jgi:sterol desaturase/sphingolipid hydroxylase (fatty acid hydroxylase superfamily)